MHTTASKTESLVGMNSCRFEFYFVLVPILLGNSDFLAVRLLWLLLLKCDKNKHWLRFENNNLIK